MGAKPKRVRNAKIIASLRAGASITAISIKHGITRQRVSQIAQWAGVAPKFKTNQGENRAMEDRLREERRAQRRETELRIETAVRNGESIASAARRFGFTRSQSETVSRRLGLGHITQHGRWNVRRAKPIEVTSARPPAKIIVRNRNGHRRSSVWSDELLTKLHTLHAKGKKYSEIAAELGISRNAAIGKLAREKRQSGEMRP